MPYNQIVVNVVLLIFLRDIKRHAPQSVCTQILFPCTPYLFIFLRYLLLFISCLYLFYKNALHIAQERKNSYLIIWVHNISMI